MPSFRSSGFFSYRLLGLSLFFILITSALLLPSWLMRRSLAHPQKDRSLTRLNQDSRSAQENARRAYGQLSPSFEENRGQFGDGVKFAARAGRYMILLTEDGAVLVPNQRRAKPKTPQPADDTQYNRPREVRASNEVDKERATAVEMKLVGASTTSEIKGTKQLPGMVNYFIGDQPQNWKTDIPTFSGVQYKNVYPGVDMVYYSKGREIEYDLVVAPGVSPNVIELSYEGAKSVKVDSESGDVLLETSEGVLRQHSPTVYQNVGRDRKSVRGSYRLKGTNRITFQVGDYDRSQSLIIDPVLSYSTTLGGDGEYSYGIAIDSAGNAYLVGEGSGFGFFGTEGSFQPEVAGAVDAAVIKLNSTGTELIYKTFIGGPQSDVGYDVAVDSAGNAYVTGFAGFNFPITSGAFQIQSGDVSDAFVTKLNPQGNGLVYSTLIGGNGTEIASTLVVDSLGNVYVGGYTESNNFPTTFGVAQAGNRGGSDGFVSKLNSTGATLIYSTLVGSSGSDNVFSLKVDTVGNVYLAGQTSGLNYPVVNPFQATSHGADRGVFRSIDAGATFSLKSNGLPDSYIEALAVDPSNSSVLYAGIRGGVFKSRNGGEDWEPTGLDRFTRTIAIDSTNTAVLYAGTNAGAYKSTNGGNTWNRMAGLFLNTTGGIFFPNVFAIKIDPSNASNVFIGTTSGPFRSTNGGTSWTRLITGLAFETEQDIRCLVFNPVTPSTVYVGTASEGVFKTTNNGTNWTAASTGLPQEPPPPINALVIDPTAPATLYAGTDFGVFKTVNGAANWTASSNGLNSLFTDGTLRTASIQSLLVNPSSPSTIYAGQRASTGATGFALTAAFKSTDGGSNWTILRNGFPPATINTIAALALQPGTPSRLLAGSYGDSEAFITKISPDGSSFLFSTYLGGELIDLATDVGLDPAGNIYVAGSTMGNGFVTTPGAFQSTLSGLRDLFVVKILAASNSPAYSTFIGGSLFEDSFGMEVDSAGNAYVLGASNSVNFPTTPGAFQRKKGDGGFSPTRDATITKVNQSGSALIYSSYLGGNEDEFAIPEVGHPIAVSPSGAAYITGQTNSNNFPIAPGPGGGEGDSSEFSFVAKIDGTVNSFSITGRLLASNGTPIDFGSVSVTGTREFFAFTDENGYYSIANVTQGTYTVAVNSFGFTFTPSSQALTNVSTDQIVNFTGNQVQRISGRISQGGTNLRNIQVNLTGSATRTTTTNSSGIFEFPDLPNGGNYTVTPVRPGFTFSPTFQSVTNLTSSLFLNFTTNSATLFTIAGQVLVQGPPGSVQIPLGGAQVICSHADTFISTVTSSGGNYSCTGLQPGEVTVTPTFAGRTFTPFRQTFVNLNSNQVQNFIGTTVTGLTNKIAFVGSPSFTTDIYIMNANGSNRLNLTGTTETEEHPAWSLDGTKLLFSRYQTDTESTEIFRINADGTSLSRLTSNVFDEFDPASSPNGTKIAFARAVPSTTGNSDIVVMNQDGTNPVNLTPTYLGNDHSPAWSPNSARIAFVRWLDVQGNSDNADIFVMNADGTGLSRLTNNALFVEDLAWSPDGTKIAFSRRVSSNQYHLFVMNADGSGQSQLTSSPAGETLFSSNSSPSWSPDGTKLVFSRSTPGVSSSKLFVINSNGTGLAVLSDPTASGSELEPAWQPTAQPVAGTTFTVTNVNDSGAGSLRQAIIDSNNNAGRDTIAFNILPTSGVKTINLLSPLPTITNPVVVDGFTQQSFSSAPLIELNGLSAGGGANGLFINAGNSVIRGLTINRFNGVGILLQNLGGNLIQSCYIGTNNTGSAPSANASIGIWVLNSPNNVIGGRAIFNSRRNVISGNGTNGFEGIRIEGAPSSGNRVLSNYLGTDASGSLAVPNIGSNVWINGAPNNIIGGVGSEDQNVISASNSNGVHISGATATGNIVQGNLIGTDWRGIFDLGNGAGVALTSAGTNNVIGGTASGARNVISGNNAAGVIINTTTGTRVEGNYIGTNATGTAAIPNSAQGIIVGAGATNNTIGGTTAGAGNTISGNATAGIQLNGNGNLVFGNFIGTNPTGTTPIPNNNLGVSISASNNQIGGTQVGRRNIIAFNSVGGVRVNSGSGNTILSNSIYGNSGAAVLLQAGANNNQPSPRMTVASVSATAVVAQGTARGPANTALTIQLFASTDCNQAERLIGTTAVTTDGAGNATFSANFPSPVDTRKFITATATDPAGNTSAVTTCADVVTNTALISGRVSDVLGNPLRNVVVTLSGAPSRVVRTNIDGRYSFTGLAPNITYTVTPQSPYYGFIPLRETFPNLSGPITADFVTQSTIPPTVFPLPSDNFDGPTRDPERWNLGVLSHPLSDFDPLVTVAQQNGKLVITPRANVTGNHFNGYVSVNSFDLTKGTVSVKLEQAGSGTTAAIFAVGEDSQNFYRFVVAGPNLPQAAREELQLGPATSAGRILYFQVVINGVTHTEQIAYDSVQHAHLRFRHDTTQLALHFESSPDGVSWTIRHSRSLLKLVDAVITELGAGTSGPDAAPGQVVFDNVQFISNTVRFVVATARVGERDGRVAIIVRRIGNTTGAAFVNYETESESASERTDFITTLGTLNFAAGEAEKSFDVLLTDDAFIEGDESFNVFLSNPLGSGLDAPGRERVTITDDDTTAGPNPIDDPRAYARQHYLDFLNRQPDQAGLDYWANQVTGCGNPDLFVCRVNVSAAFFFSIEFQETGYLVYRTYKAAYGNMPNKPVPVQINDFLGDTQKIGLGVVVGAAGWEQKLETNKQAFMSEFNTRTRFITTLPGFMTAAQFVDKLNQNAGGALSQSERDALVSSLTNGTKTRAQVLRAVAEDPTLRDSEFRKAFVLFQYFGYLRRNPDDLPDNNFGGYNFWLSKLNQFNGNFVDAEMVKAFILSDEYRHRFGP